MNKRFGLAAVFVVLALGLAWGLWRMTVGGALDKAAQLAKDVEVDVSMQGIELSQGREGRVQWRLKASGAEYLQEGGLIRVDSPVVTYYGGADGQGPAASGSKPGSTPIVVTAPKGEVLQDDEVVTLWPDVTVTMGMGEMRAERLVFTGKETRTIRLTGSVVMHRGEMAVRAPEVEYDLDKDIIVAKGGVEADLNPSPVADKGAAQ